MRIVLITFLRPCDRLWSNIVFKLIGFVVLWALFGCRGRVLGAPGFDSQWISEQVWRQFGMLFDVFGMRSLKQLSLRSWVDLEMILKFALEASLRRELGRCSPQGTARIR